MLELDPTDDQKSLINECMRCRGLLVGSYAHVEFLLADLCIKSWKLPEYRSLSKKFPHRAESRFRGVRDILAVKNGPLFHFRDPAEQLLGQWQDSERDRHRAPLWLLP